MSEAPARANRLKPNPVVSLSETESHWLTEPADSYVASQLRKRSRLCLWTPGLHERTNGIKSTLYS